MDVAGLARIFLSAVSLLALWCLGGFLAFLLLPVISNYPCIYGLWCGAFLWLVQILWGHCLVRLLLRWRADVSPKLMQMGVISEIDSSCPMVLRFSGLPGKCRNLWSDGIIVSSGAIQAGCVDKLGLDEWRQCGLTTGEVWFLSNALAVPCLMRAFESLTNSYGKLRFSEGPLWYLGRVVGCLAVLLEMPLRFCWGEERVSVELGRTLYGKLLDEKCLPAWGRALDLLSPVSFSELVRRRRALERQESWNIERVQMLPVAVGEPALLLAVLWGAVIGLVCAVSPWRIWGAVPLGIGLGGLVGIVRRWPPLTQSVIGACEVPEGQGSANAVRVAEVSGILVAVPDNFAFADIKCCLQDKHGVLALTDMPASKYWRQWMEQKQCVTVRGWWNSDALELQVARLEVAGRRWHRFFKWQCALPFAALALAGGAWWALQVIGL